MKTHYHPDPAIDTEVRADAALGAQRDLAAGLAVQCCPRCGRDHGRGYVDGVSAFRCLACGVVVSPEAWRLPAVRELVLAGDG